VRALAIVVTLALSVSCASTSSVGTTTTVYADKTQLWLAAQRAIREMGGKIVHADEASGTVAGRIDVEGTPIDLSASIWGSPATAGATVDYYDVEVRASLVGVWCWWQMATYRCSCPACCGRRTIPRIVLLGNGPAPTMIAAGGTETP
jgi:hypothetical protein